MKWSNIVKLFGEDDIEKFKRKVRRIFIRHLKSNTEIDVLNV